MTEMLEKRLALFEPELASEAEQQVFQDFTTSLEELRAVSEEHEACIAIS